VQIFYAWRIWSCSLNKFVSAIPVVITVLALARGFSAITYMLECWGFKRHFSDPFSTFVQTILHMEFPIWSVGGLLPDTLIVICMVHIMFQSDPNSSPTSKSKASTPMFTMVQVGGFPRYARISTWPWSFFFPSTNYHFVPAYILGKMYSNSLISMLNSRHSRSRTML